MGTGYGRYAADKLAEALHERMIGVWHTLVARGEEPDTAEEFANIVVHTVFDALAGGLAKLNADSGMHPDDLRAREDQPTLDRVMKAA